MRLAVLLLTCLVGLSYQQMYAPWLKPYHQRALFYPSYYLNPIYNGYPVRSFYTESDRTDSAKESFQVRARTPVQKRNGLDSAKENIRDQARTLISKYFPEGKFFSLPPGTLQLARVLTSTVYLTATQTVFNVSSGNCIGAALFLDTKSIAITCRRKRDSGVLPELLALDAENERQILASQTSPLVASALPSFAARSDDVQPEIVSSLDDTQVDYSSGYPDHRKDRKLTSITTVTSTITTVAFSTTTFIRTLSTSNFAATAKVTCLPSGYYVC